MYLLDLSSLALHLHPLIVPYLPDLTHVVKTPGVRKQVIKNLETWNDEFDANTTHLRQQLLSQNVIKYVKILTILNTWGS